MNNLEENLGLNCVALYKVAKLKGKSLPDERVHIYLAGLIDRFEKPSFEMSKFVVGSIDELNKVVIANQGSFQPNAIPYLVSKYSGDYSTNYSAHISDIFNVSFPSACYSLAQYYGAKMGKKEESLIFGLLALNPEKYISLLSSYYSLLKEDDFEITDEDFQSFKKDLENKFIPPKITLTGKKVKKNPEVKFLI
jgi:hypothetical protein